MPTKTANALAFSYAKAPLAEALATASRATKAGAHLAALGCLKLSVGADRILTITGTTLDLTIEVVLPVEDASPGEVVLPAKLLTEVVRSMDDRVSLCPGEVTDTVAITAGRSRFALRQLDAGEFPRTPETQGDPVTVEAEVLAPALRKVALAASSGESTPVINGVLLEARDGGLRLVATDRYRLAFLDLPALGSLARDTSLIIPAAALTELGRLLEKGTVTVSADSRQVTFTAGAVKLTSRLIEGQFPPYQQVVDSAKSGTNRLSVPRQPLIDAVKRVKLMATDDTTPIRLDLGTAGLFGLQVITPDVGQADEAVDGIYEGTAVELGFNPNYLLAGLGALDCDDVVLEITDPMKPVLVREVDDDAYGYVIMPVKLPAKP